jgi:hypothetical protein
MEDFMTKRRIEFSILIVIILVTALSLVHLGKIVAIKMESITNQYEMIYELDIPAGGLDD